MVSPEARAFAWRVTELARRLGVLTDPVFDEARFRLVERGVSVDLYNPWHVTGCTPDPDEPRLARMLAPLELGEAGYLGRLDVVQRRLAAGADPNAPEPDGVLPLQRTLAAWVTTDLHIAVVEALFAAGLSVERAHVDTLLADTVGTEIDHALERLLVARAW